eukprot:XP_011679183.1 PREDICTED: uncharacterized protein LOC105445381 [Strongylocentrotus purpuratus]
MAEKSCDSDNDGTSSLPGPTPRKRRRRRSGLRCLAGGCSNTAYDGFFIHLLARPGGAPTESTRFTTHQKAWIDFIGRKRKFDCKLARTYKRIVLCSGHFREEDYESTQMRMYKHGLRTKPPDLQKGAIPTIDVAKQPFPPEWFDPLQVANQPSIGNILSSPACTTSSPASAIPSPATPVPSVPSPQDQGQDADVDLDLQAQLQEEAELNEEPTLPSNANLSGTTSGSTSSSSYLKRSTTRQSMYIMKKELQAIRKEYAEKAETDKALERAKEILERSKGEQFSVKMVHHKVGTSKIGKRSCKVQVKPVTLSKGTQANFFKKPETVNASIQCCDAATQTTESHFNTPVVQEEEEEEEPEEESDDADDEDKDPTYDPLSSSDEEKEDV